MKKKELFLGILAVIAGSLICGCSNVKISSGGDDGDTFLIDSGHDSEISEDVLADEDDEDDEEDASDDSSGKDLKNPTFSKDYIAGIDFGGKPFWYDEIYETVSATLIFTTDKTVEVYMGQSLYGEHDTLVGTVSLSDKQYMTVKNAVNQKTLYKLDPGSDENMCDGFFKYIYLYDENNELLKEVGDYEPTNKKFLNAYGSLNSIVPYEEVHEIMEKQKQIMRYNDCLADIEKLTEDDLIVSEAEKIIAPFEDGEMLMSEDWTDDTEKCFRIKIINKDDHRLTKDYFFYCEDATTIIPIAVYYPTSEEVGADRYFEYNWGDNEAIFDDVNFDGHEDLLITLDKEDIHNKIRCAYIFDNGEFVYNPSFEKIVNYKADSKKSVILSEEYGGKVIQKKYGYDKESKTFIEIE